MLNASTTERNPDPRNVAIIGGGINGLCTTWILTDQGHRVTLFESHRLTSETSSASTKLLHGGLRHLETYQLVFTWAKTHRMEFSKIRLGTLSRQEHNENQQRR